MARIRTIKPQFFTSLSIADLPYEARLTFIGLWTHADDEGRCVDDARLIKAAVWPLDDRTAADVERDLRLLSESSVSPHGVDMEDSFVIRYTVRGRRYLAVREWGHQRINRPTPSQYPAPEEGEPTPPLTSGDEPSRMTHCGLSESSVSPHGGLTLGIRNREGNKEQGKTLGQLAIDGSAEHRETEAAPPALSAFEDLWTLYPRKIAKANARKAWAKAIKDGADPARVIAGAKTFAEFCELAKTEPRFIPHAATWLRAERWLDEPQPLARAAGDWQPYRNAPADAWNPEDF